MVLEITEALTEKKNTQSCNEPIHDIVEGGWELSWF